MSNFFRKKIVIFVLIVTVIILGFVMATMVQKGDRTSIAENATGTIVTPVQSLLSKSATGIGNFFDGLIHFHTYQQENVALSAQKDKLEQDIVDLQSLETENQRLRALLDMKEKLPEYDTTGANVIARENGNWYEILTIDKGQNKGIEKNSVVISATGAVGYVCEVGQNWAKVMTLLDSNSAVSAVVPRTGDHGIAEGDFTLAKKGCFKLSYLPGNSGIIVGDIVETSGLGGIYPAGLQLGKVVEVNHDRESLSLTATIEPVTDFNRLTEVLILLSK